MRKGSGGNCENIVERERRKKSIKTYESRFPSPSADVELFC